MSSWKMEGKESSPLQTLPFISQLLSHCCDSVEHSVQVETKYKLSCQRLKAFSRQVKALSFAESQRGEGK